MDNEDVSGWGPCVCGKIAIGDGHDFSVIGQGTRRYWCGDVACRPAGAMSLCSRDFEIWRRDFAVLMSGQSHMVELSRALQQAAKVKP